MPAMTSRDEKIRTDALLRAEGAALSRLNALRRDLVDVLGLIDRVVPPRRAEPGATALDLGNLVSFERRQHRENNK